MGGTSTTVKQIAESVRAVYGVPVDLTLHCDGDPPRGAAGAGHLYSIITEALNNAVRHAHPTKITVDLNVDNGSIHLEVRNDGVTRNGTPAGASPPGASGGNGLVIMAYRATEIGCVLTAGPTGSGEWVVQCTPVSSSRSSKRDP